MTSSAPIGREAHDRAAKRDDRVDRRRGRSMDTATRASVARLRALARPSAVLITRSSPSSSTHTGETLGPPSGSRLATCARTFLAMSSRAAGVNDIGHWLPDDIGRAEGSFTVMNIGAHVRGGGKLVPSLEEGVNIGATSIQIFMQSPRMWKPSQYAPGGARGVSRGAGESSQRDATRSVTRRT